MLAVITDFLKMTAKLKIHLLLHAPPPPPLCPLEIINTQKNKKGKLKVKYKQQAGTGTTGAKKLHKLVKKVEKTRR